MHALVAREARAETRPDRRRCRIVIEVVSHVDVRRERDRRRYLRCRSRGVAAALAVKFKVIKYFICL